MTLGDAMQDHSKNELKNTIRIKIHSWVDGETQEELEDKLKELLVREGIEATIENEATGNSLAVKKGVSDGKVR